MDDTAETSGMDRNKGKETMTGDEANHEPTIVVNVEKPTIKVGSVFPDQLTFKTAIWNYAILSEFEFDIDYSDTSKFGASCSAKDCKWQIHASRLQDGHCFQVLS